MQIFRGLGRWPLRIGFSPDGSLLGAGDDRAFHMWDVGGSPDPLWTVDNGPLGRTFTFVPDGGAVTAIYYSGLLWFDARTGARTDGPALTASHTHPAPDGWTVVSVARDQATGVQRFRALRPTVSGWTELWHHDRTFNPHLEWHGYRALLFAPDATRLARVRSLDRPVQNVSRTGIEVFDLATGEVLADWVGQLPTYAREGTVSPQGVAVLLRERALFVVDTARPESEPVKRLNSTLKHFTSVAFSRDGAQLATTSNDTAATLWDVTAWEPRRRYEWDIGRLRTVCFAPDGLRCAAGGDTGQIVVWDLDD
ncbi:WD40 repeat domain-containing protein [Gemmata sp. JC717]|uniref:WD40 repeat domain-containing protein n=1 Tax=Gemmata algarum TaxID=2975278 RepID=UPI0021BAD6FA|nr:WD40 repeat domain-containing protein [Gemmata algarum]MDY3557066.1 WD40 repeat domain-containing protein [Gemmata algarum]